jgi:vacuolar protein sorting-associated protein 13A/C
VFAKQGFVGAVTKPVVGVFDFASNVTEGIRNTTTVFDQDELERVRLPRFIGSDGILRVSRVLVGTIASQNIANQKFCT